MKCTKCGCTDENCSQCVAAQGKPCHWVADGKCSRCFDEDGKEKMFDDGWWYETTDDNSARFVLGQPGEKTLVCFGVNPSTATPDKLDDTLRSVKRIAGYQGYDGWLMFNLYPQRATNPNDLPVESERALVTMNRYWISRSMTVLALEFGEMQLWGAWGALIEKRAYLAESLRQIANDFLEGTQWITIGQRSQAGHPHHPLYLANHAEAAPFDIDEYLVTTLTKENEA